MTVDIVREKNPQSVQGLLVGFCNTSHEPLWHKSLVIFSPLIIPRSTLVLNSKHTLKWLL